MRATQGKWARKSFLISVVIHGALFIFFAIYVIGVSTKVQEVVNTVFVSESKPQDYKPRPQMARPIVSPSLPQTQVVSTDFVPVVTTKRSSSSPGREPKSSILFKASDDSIDNIGSPTALTKSDIAPRVMTEARVRPSATDSTVPPAVSGSMYGQAGPGTGLGGGGGIGVGGSGRGRTGSVVTAASPAKQSLSMTQMHSALKVEDGLAEVAAGVRLGRSRFPPLPDGEPGGMVIGRGKDMEGRIRFARVKHFLADWWSDPCAMPGLMHWMNTNTQIHVDMSVEGGSFKLDDPKLLKSPLALMTGHDRILLISAGLRGNYIHTLTESERTGLRRYLVEAGGLLFFDACGHTLALTNQIKAELRSAIPEHSIENIPNTHELYTCYYDLGGPPPGAYRFWKHGTTWPPRGVSRHIQGLFIKDNLAAIISDRDYLCGARTKSRPGHGNTGEDSPSSYRFLANVIIYALTHGNISEHSDYVPELKDAEKISINVPVNVPILMPE